MATRPDATPVQFRRSPGNAGPFDMAPPPVAQATDAPDWLAALRDTTLRQRFHGAAMMLMGLVAVSSGLLVVELGYATMVGAGMGIYGVYLWMR